MGCPKKSQKKLLTKKFSLNNSFDITTIVIT